MDGQYLHGSFHNSINKAIWKHLPSEKSKDPKWWFLQWNPAHWIDKVFRPLGDSEFVKRLLMRTNLFQSTFGHGKMHVVTKETLK